MRPRVLRRHLALAGATLSSAGIARATPETDYLDMLTDGGLTIYDTSAAIAYGYDICAAVDAGYNGAQVAQAVYANTTFADVPTIATAEYMVVSAVLSLCPWNYNPQGTAVAVAERPAHPDVPITAGVGGILQ